MNTQEFATTLARDAGVIIRKHFSDEITKDWKPDNTPVTVADREVNDLVVQRVKEAFPEHGLLIEEADSFSTEAELLWVCDPIDGTVPYSHAIPMAAFSLALVQDGQPILGVIYDPFLDRMYAAAKGQGTTLNGRPIRVSDVTTLERQLIGTVKWRNPDINFSRFDERLVELGARPINVVVTTYLGMLVTTGQFAANIFHGNKPWDTAAQKIIVEEAGGKVTDLYGNGQRYDQDTKGMVASNGKVHELLLNLLHDD